MQKLDKFLESSIWRNCLNAFCLMLILGACSSLVALPLHEAGRDDLLSWVLDLGAGFTPFGYPGSSRMEFLRRLLKKIYKKYGVPQGHPLYGLANWFALC